MVRMVCLDAEKHGVSMMAELHQMKQDNDHCDFIIQVEDDVYPTNKNVLSAGSAYFRAMLKHDTKESRGGRVVLKDVDSECVKSCIDVIYSSKFEIPDGKIVELLHVAIMMQLEDVRDAISDILAESITVENYFSTRNAGDIYGLVDVTSRCRIFLQENSMEIANDAGFGSVERSDFLNLLKSSKSKLWEEDKLVLTLKWIEGCEKKEKLSECLELIEFVEISPVFLQELLETHSIFKRDSELDNLIRSHIQKASVEQVKKRELIILFDGDTDCIRSFNPISEKITMFHSAQFRHLHCFTPIVLHQYIYILCENKSVHRLNFKRKKSNWQKMKDMIFNHGSFPCSVSLSGSIFVIGSGSFDKASNDVERFDTSANQWIQLQKRPTAICDASLVTLDDSIYCIGGWRDRVELSSFCRFTPSSSQWVDLEPLGCTVSTSGAVAIDQKIFVIGGLRYFSMIDIVQCYDVTSAQWTSLPSLHCGSCSAAHHFGNWIYIMDGYIKSYYFGKYDLINRKWYTVDDGTDPTFRLYGSAMVKV